MVRSKRWLLGMADAKVAPRNAAVCVPFSRGVPAEGRRLALDQVVREAVALYESEYGPLDWDQACMTVAYATTKVVVEVWSGGDDMNGGV